MSGRVSVAVLRVSLLPLRRSPVRPRRVTLLLERMVPPTGSRSLSSALLRVWVCAPVRVSVDVVPVFTVVRRVCVVAVLPELSRVEVVVVPLPVFTVVRRVCVVAELPLLRVDVLPELPVDVVPVVPVLRRICVPDEPVLLPEEEEPEVARRTGVMPPE